MSAGRARGDVDGEVQAVARRSWCGVDLLVQDVAFLGAGEGEDLDVLLCGIDV
ncbi:hypothetical protein [Streptomyces phaeochromogenes]|uniref:hypothetical protein n=1 Tax=Streptomyces phaeochromogenes TaxID=1923 RepID=UPI00386735FA|nr:hypothetical protein OG277_15925 [Streptomyces phaeochromogenes]